LCNPASTLITPLLPSYRALLRRFTSPTLALPPFPSPLFHSTLSPSSSVFHQFTPTFFNFSLLFTICPLFPKLINFSQFFPNFSKFSQLFVQFFQTYSLLPAFLELFTFYPTYAKLIRFFSRLLPNFLPFAPLLLNVSPFANLCFPSCLLPRLCQTHPLFPTPTDLLTFCHASLKLFNFFPLMPNFLPFPLFLLNLSTFFLSCPFIHFSPAYAWLIPLSPVILA